MIGNGAERRGEGLEDGEEWSADDSVCHGRDKSYRNSAKAV